ncbi:MAG TPA: cobalamin-dependent protein [Acidimicrobiales bacterium]|nr:cobalamin-dependent protein [Acidimicrobiales bacterium]
MDEDDLTLEQAAARLGLHYMTVYRHVRTGRLPASYRDGRWRIRPRDLAHPTSVPGKGTAPKGRPAGRKAPAERMTDRLLAGDGPGAWLIIEEALLSGAPRDAYLGLLAPSLRTIGEWWAAGRISVADEHRATAVALGLMGRLGPMFARRGRPGAGSVLLAGAEGDAHAIPVLMVGDVLRAEGFRVVQLGADLPVGALVTAAAAADVDAVGLSAATAGGLERAAGAIAELQRRAPWMPVMFGGPAVTSELAEQAGADGWAPDAAGCAQTLTSLIEARRAEKTEEGIG